LPKENNGPAISHKEDNATLMSYFREVLTDFDEERVYPSDVKKILNTIHYKLVKFRSNKREAAEEEPKKVKKSKE
jgi:hypothetical protein